MNVAGKRIVARLDDGHATLQFWSSAARATLGAPPGLIDAPALTGEQARTLLDWRLYLGAPGAASRLRALQSIAKEDE